MGNAIGLAADLVRGEVVFALIDRLNKHERANRVTFVFRSRRLDQSSCVGVGGVQVSLFEAAGWIRL